MRRIIVIWLIHYTHARAIGFADFFRAPDVSNPIGALWTDFPNAPKYIYRFSNFLISVTAEIL